MKPFLKWPGNKYRIINHISKVLPQGNRLVEPFVGSGAVFLNVNFSSYIIAEKNSDLVNLYQILRDNGDSFINYAKEIFHPKYNTENKYYRNRKLFNKTNNLELKAAIFIYLNRHGYNGLCRYNLDGEYNVPYGFYKSPYFPHKEMHYFHHKLQNVAIKCWDYRKTLQYVRKGDIVYCDPPYVPLSKTASFTQYGPFGFDNFDQIQLAKKAENLAKKGITVVISNHNTEFIRKLYSAAKITNLYVQRNISCKGHTRNRVKEVLAVFS